MKMMIDTDDISKKLANSIGLAESVEAENTFVEVLEIYEKLGDFIEIAKERMKDEFLAVDKNFTGVKLNKLKIEVRKFGAVYKFDEENEADKAFVVERISKSVNGKAVEKYASENDGELPIGIVENERKASLVVKKLG